MTPTTQLCPQLILTSLLDTSALVRYLHIGRHCYPTRVGNRLSVCSFVQMGRVQEGQLSERWQTQPVEG